MEWLGQNAIKKGRISRDLFLVVFVVEFRRIPETEDLTGRVTRENAVRSLGLERDDSHIPGAGPIRRRHASARQPFERFQLENGARGSYGADGIHGCRLDCHTYLPSPATGSG